jgi:hypothetical protein
MIGAAYKDSANFKGALIVDSNDNYVVNAVFPGVISIGFSAFLSVLTTNYEYAKLGLS